MKTWIQSDGGVRVAPSQIPDDLLRVGILRVNDHVQRGASAMTRASVSYCGWAPSAGSRWTKDVRSSACCQSGSVAAPETTRACATLSTGAAAGLGALRVRQAQTRQCCGGRGR